MNVSTVINLCALLSSGILAGVALTTWQRLPRASDWRELAHAWRNVRRPTWRALAREWRL